MSSRKKLFEQLFVYDCVGGFDPMFRAVVFRSDLSQNLISIMIPCIIILKFSVLFIWALGLIEPNKTLIQFHGKITPFFTFLGQLKFLDNQCRWLPNKTQLNLYLSSVQIYFLKLSRYIFIQKFKKFKTKILLS